MKLSEVLHAHDSHLPPQSLKQSLGDGYLIAHNPLFRALRRAAAQSRIEFTSQGFHDYEALSLTQLPQILAKKTVPYVNNVRPLREIEARVPGEFKWDEIPPLKSNYVMHETAHVLARIARLGHVGELKLNGGASLEDQRALAFILLLEESFANAVESLANAFANNEIHDEFLFKNAYVMETEKVRKVLRSGIRAFSLSVCFRILVLSFLHANFIQTRMSEIDFKAVAKFAFLGTLRGQVQKDHDLLKRVFQIGLDLDPAFTLFTNRFCLRLEGIETELHELLGFDCLGVLRQEPNLALFYSFEGILGLD